LVPRLLEDLLVLTVALRFEFLVGHEAQRRRVDAVAQAALGGRAIVEDMAEMAVTVARTNFSADHAVARVRVLDHIFGLERNREARPAATAVELLGGREQRFARDDVDVDARLFLVPEVIVEGRFGGTLLSHRVLALVELGDRLGVLAVVAGHLGLPFSAPCFTPMPAEMRPQYLDEQARRHRGFAGCAKHTAGVRTIPVLELKRRRRSPSGVTLLGIGYRATAR
jgi:hypothetical protein